MKNLNIKSEPYFVIYNTLESLYQFFGSNYSKEVLVMVENLMNDLYERIGKYENN